MIITAKGKSGSIDELQRKAATSEFICIRCGGLLVKEAAIDFSSSTGEVEQGARRCVQCGDVIDAVILRHRQIGLGSSSLPLTVIPVPLAESHAAV